MRVVVVPTNRPESMQQWLDAWAPVSDWDRLIIVVDGPETLRLETHGLNVLQTAWPAYRDQLGDKSWIISRKDSACRCFGFWLAWRSGATHIATLDDDCLPIDPEWFGRHVAVLENTPKWASTVNGVRPRGMPYRETGRLDSLVANVGLWDGVPDLDAVHGLACPRSDFRASGGTEIWGSGQYRPMCGMNLCFKRDATPLMYFPLMGEGQPYRRMDDIWAGVIAKRCCDALGWCMSSGPPFVRHSRQSDPLANLAKESPGIVENEKFWQYVDEINVSGDGPLEAMRSIADWLPPEGYYGTLSKAIDVWCSLFEETS